MEPNSVDAIVTDPPYGLSFMGKDWDFGVPGVAFWAEALRVAKPGAMLLAFGGTRTFHRLTCAIEDAGWEVRDVITWLYGSGFPKSHDISKAIDKAAGVEREVVGVRQDFAKRAPKNNFDQFTAINLSSNGINSPALAQKMGQIIAPATPAAQQWHGRGTALKPAWEPIILAMKPIDGTFVNNAQAWGVAGLNVDGCRVGTEGRPLRIVNGQHNNGIFQMGSATAEGTTTVGRWPANLILDEDAAVALDAQSGVRTSATYKPNSGTRSAIPFKPAAGWNQHNMNPNNKTAPDDYGDTGGASRFFYVAKASRAERNAGLEGMEGLHADAHNLSSNACARCGKRVKANGSGDKCDCGELRETIKLPTAANHHPTVKPLALMRYLVRLVSTPTGGTVLDPFMGSGTTGIACALEGADFIGIELDEEYFEIAKKRIASVHST